MAVCSCLSVYHGPQATTAVSQNVADQQQLQASLQEEARQKEEQRQLAATLQEQCLTLQVRPHQLLLSGRFQKWEHPIIVQIYYNPRFWGRPQKGWFDLDLCNAFCSLAERVEMGVCSAPDYCNGEPEASHNLARACLGFRGYMGVLWGFMGSGYSRGAIDWERLLGWYSFVVQNYQCPRRPP